MIRVLLVDDQRLFREGLRTLLSIYDDIELVGEAANGEEALSQTQALKPDVVLMDLRMPHMDGVEATRQLTEQAAACRVIILTTFDEDEYLFDALRAGAIGYLLKDVTSQKLVEGIRAAASGQPFLQPVMAGKLIAEYARLTSPDDPPGKQSQPLVEPLSQRELEILKELGRGASNKEIGARLYISEGTVKNHVSHILGKLGVSSRGKAIHRARALGLIA